VGKMVATSTLFDRRLRPYVVAASTAAVAAAWSYASTAHAAFTQATCDPTVGVPVFADMGANEFNRRYTDSSHYDLDEYRGQMLMVNGNVNTVRFGYVDFNTEFGYDQLKLYHGTGSWHTLHGNLGTGDVTLSPAGGASNQFFVWQWKSDYSITKASNPRITAATVRCNVTPSATTPHQGFGPNARVEGLLIADGDVIYTSITQPAFTRMILTVDVLASAASAPDVDLYASTTTTMPDNSNYTWRGYNGNPGAGSHGDKFARAGEALDLGTTSSQRTVYIGIRSYQGRSHYALRGNVLRFDFSGIGSRSVKVCHPNVPNIGQHANWPEIEKTLRFASIRTLILTHGNVFIDTYNMKYLNNNGGNAFCSSDSTCDWCMTDPAFADSCGYQVQWGPSTEKMRIPNAACLNGSGPGDYADPEGFSLGLLHEIGHYFFRLTGPPYGAGFEGNEEYDGRAGYGHPFCKHSVMNGPWGGAYRFCVHDDHCKGAGTPEPGFICDPVYNMWSRIENGTKAYMFRTFPAQGSGAMTAQIGKFAHRNFFSRQLVNFTTQ
jgi:hypothetical protein